MPIIFIGNLVIVLKFSLEIIVSFFSNSSGVIGAGLLVLSKFPIVSTLFHSWTVNGYCHRIQHADWFGGKGVGMCRIRVGDRYVHLYNAHVSIFTTVFLGN